MPNRVTLVVTDAPPLITLAAAQSLDYLLYPALPVIIPDAVFFEATGSAGKLGAQEIMDWYRQHADRVRIEPTQRDLWSGHDPEVRDAVKELLAQTRPLDTD